MGRRRCPRAPATRVAPMILERSMHDQFLSNTYVVADENGGTAVMIDAGGPVQPLLQAIEDRDLVLSHVLLTHHHFDHVCEPDQVLARHPDAQVLIHPAERDEVEGATGTIEPGDTVQAGGLSIEAIHTPGHTKRKVSFLVDGNVFTGDTLFRNSVGGVRAPGHTTYADLKESIMDRLMALPPETAIHPGHTDPTTVADEWEGNAFIRVWRGLGPEGGAGRTARRAPPH